MGFCIGIDLGTSGCRVITIDEQADVVSTKSRSLPASVSPAQGEQQQDPQDWWQTVSELLQETIAEIGNKPVDAIAVDGTSSTLLLTDQQGTPITPALMYNDSRSRDSLEILNSVAPVGSPVLSASSSLAKLLHLSRKQTTESYYALHQADWIVGRLTGNYRISDENNALKLGYDPITRQWPEWINRLDFNTNSLPQVHPCGRAIGKLSREAAQASGLSSGTIVVTGTTDSNAACLASGANEIGDAVTSLGSTLVLKILSDKPVYDSRYGIYSHRLGDRWLVGGASNSGGSVLRHYFKPNQLPGLTAAMKIDQPTGLDYYPLVSAGERFPINDPDLAPRLSPRPESDSIFFQAILEGIAKIEQQGYQRLQELGAPSPKRVFSIGGGAVNEPWRRMREQYLEATVIRAAQQEAAYGAALFALNRVKADR
ncbi:MAG: FGGY-family carbohydrate kinase [Candidatus Thiodiazotropha lotti]|nr:FGGY-family carbohydrate kinase [Candidatus Thiodiazotropha lotti]MCG7999781.1 FGGY-family carbohydrate kinase [Candidatus Thiodiazotropha lotti]MCW4182058.1 FGGY-family carbohydrate kinase [Candidatus Thiodiazotropha weberae]MCW4191550.1 FGGY-family carbohydrate kinase [Candidatus Thiodiazotropha weberae]